MVDRFFVGFSTADSAVTRERTFYDLDLCIKDLTNHFYTRPGERCMRPEWGCGIWNYIMEPLTPGMKEIIMEEALAVVEADPRCTGISANVIEIDHGFTVAITMTFEPSQAVARFSLDFDARNATYFS